MSLSSVLPDRWGEYFVGDLLEFSNGVNADKGSYGRGMPFANVLEVISNESLTEDQIPGKVDISRTLVDRYQVVYGDILFNRTSETQSDLGLSSVYLGKSPVLFGGFVFRGRPRTNLLDTGFSKYVFRSSSVRDQIQSMGQGGIRANLGQKDIKRVRLALPPVPEQREISNAIADVDELTQNLRMMIRKKHDIKLGMMQQLLTGRTRLSGFDEPWREVALGDCVQYLRTIALPRALLDRESSLGYLHYGDIHKSSIPRLDAAAQVLPRVSTELARNADMLRKGDLVFVDASEDPAGIGKSVEITATSSGGEVSGLHTIAARFDKQVLLDGFKMYLQFMPEFRSSLLRLASGTKVLATSRRHISSTKLRLPGLEEQSAIVGVLSAIEDEVQVLRMRTKKAEDVKQGMMQELLSGRIRLPA